MKERRRHFLINRPLQFRYMAYLTVTLVGISLVTLLSLYIGIWGSILDSFSEASLQNDILTASRLTQYDAARFSAPASPELSSLSFFKQSEKLSHHQRELFKKILNDTNRKLAWKLTLLFFFIAWGSVYVSHKIAGPLYRLHSSCLNVGKGDLSVRIHLRKFDEGQFLAESFNQMMESIDHHYCKIKNIVKENETKPERLADRMKEELAKMKTSAGK